MSDGKKDTAFALAGRKIGTPTKDKKPGSKH
jgi:hypothetical protein